jgi:hypothetical protein
LKRNYKLHTLKKYRLLRLESLRFVPARKTRMMQIRETMVRTIGVAIQAILPSLPMLTVELDDNRRIEAICDEIKEGGLD